MKINHIDEAGFQRLVEDLNQMTVFEKIAKYLLKYKGVEVEEEAEFFHISEFVTYMAAIHNVVIASITPKYSTFVQDGEVMTCVVSYEIKL